jgi:hypothetical protein
MKNRDVDLIVGSLAPETGATELSAGALELMHEIVALPVGEVRHPLRLRIAFPLVACMTIAALALAWTGFGFGTTPATAALSIERRGDHYVIVVSDLFASPEKYQRELRAHGLDITLTVRPVPTRSVGEIIPMPGGPVPHGDGTNGPVFVPNYVTALQRHGSCAPNCSIGLSIPVDFRGKEDVILGRAARPGEAYALIDPVDSPGEPLHCVPFIHKKLGQVQDLLLQHGVTRVELTDGSSRRMDFPDTWYVQQGYALSTDTALLLVSPTKKMPDVPGPVMTATRC